MAQRNYSFFQNKKCEFFPCHSLESDIEDFNCLFCFCPLYNIPNCGGNNISINVEGYPIEKIKDCSGCQYPHQRQNYDAILLKLKANDDFDVILSRVKTQH